MYRMINQNDWPYQRFVWREDESQPLQEFSLTTVTFEEASAPFTAVNAAVIADDNLQDFSYCRFDSNRE